MTPNVYDELRDLKRLEDHHAKLTKAHNIQVAEIKKSIIDKYCPHKVGDTVVMDVWGIAVNKPGRDLTMRVSEIHLDRGATPNRWEIRGFEGGKDNVTGVPNGRSYVDVS